MSGIMILYIILIIVCATLLFFGTIEGYWYGDNIENSLMFGCVVVLIVSVILLGLTIASNLTNLKDITSENFTIERSTYIEDNNYKTKYIVTLDNGDKFIATDITISDKNLFICTKDKTDELDYTIKKLTINQDVATELGLTIEHHKANTN